MTIVGFNYPWAWDQHGLYFGAGKPPGNEPGMDHEKNVLYASLTGKGDSDSRELTHRGKEFVVAEGFNG